MTEEGVGLGRASNFVRLCYGVSPISSYTAQLAEEVFGKVLCQAYGQAEAPMTISLLEPDEHHLFGSAGRPYRTTTVRVVDEEDNVLGPGEAGEIVCRGPIFSAGYWNLPDESEATHRGGWLHTGDIGTVDENGYLFLMDRRNDLIISGRFNMYPREVEDALMQHPAVVEAAVVSIPDEKWGEIVQAVVTVRQEVATNDLDGFLKERLAGYKRPRGYRIVPELPKSAAGKILRRTVRDELRAEVGAGG